MNKSRLVAERFEPPWLRVTVSCGMRCRFHRQYGYAHSSLCAANGAAAGKCLENIERRHQTLYLTVAVGHRQAPLVQLAHVFDMPVSGVCGRTVLTGLVITHFILI